MRERLLSWSALFLLLAAPALAGTALLVNRPQANLRAEASAQAARVATLSQGEEVELLERRAEWCRVRTPDGQEGWIHGDLMLEQWMVTATTARVRSAGSTSAPPVAAVAAGEEVTKLSQRGGWLEVSLPDGKRGWIASNLVRPKSLSLAPAARPRSVPPSRPAPAPAKVEEAEPAADDQEPPGSASSDSGIVRGNPYTEGLQHVNAGDYEAALASFEAVLEQNPQNLNALFNAVKAHRQLGQTDRALTKLYRIMALAPNRRDLFRELSEVYQAAGRPDSAAKYQALFRGQEWEPSAEVEETAAAAPADGRKDLAARLDRVPWIMVAAGVGAVGVLAVVLFLLLRRRPEPVDEDLDDEAPTPARRGRFAQTMRQTATRGPALDRGAEEELDRQIEAKRAELRQSSEAFLGTAPLGKGASSEDQHLEELLGHLENLRAALHLQDERERVYADLVRLQGMKLEVMEREVALLKRRGRS
ncbi:MAG: SH3 domain-containing protein [Candidatus Latescibacterota bacterium]|jgi:tetratricopeptide (TPR) repeat protein/SH3-like domain-containing protein